jgi:hypothetical protein
MIFSEPTSPAFFPTKTTSPLAPRPLITVGFGVSVLSVTQVAASGTPFGVQLLGSNQSVDVAPFQVASAAAAGSIDPARPSISASELTLAMCRGLRNGLR